MDTHQTDALGQNSSIIKYKLDYLKEKEREREKLPETKVKNVSEDKFPNTIFLIYIVILY